MMERAKEKLGIHTVKGPLELTFLATQHIIETTLSDS